MASAYAQGYGVTGLSGFALAKPPRSSAKFSVKAALILARRVRPKEIHVIHPTQRVAKRTHSD